MSLVPILYAVVLFGLWLATIVAAGVGYHVLSNAQLELSATYASSVALTTVHLSSEQSLDAGPDSTQQYGLPANWTGDSPLWLCTACQTFNNTGFDYCRNCASDRQLAEQVDPDVIEQVETTRR